jgi:hypothetical protein
MNVETIQKVLNMEVKGNCPRGRLMLKWEQKVRNNVTRKTVGRN